MQDKWINRLMVVLLSAGYLLILGNVLAYLKNNLRLTDNAITGYGQLLAGWILLPAAVIMLAFALRKFNQSHLLPVLKLEWQGDEQAAEDGDWLVLNGRQTNAQELKLSVRNEGELVVVWYRITVELPEELVAWGKDKFEFAWAVGSAENRNYFESKGDETIIYDFKSAGQPALYPEEHTHIATLRFGPGAADWQGKIHAYIVTDKTRIVHQEQKVKIQG